MSVESSVGSKAAPAAAGPLPGPGIRSLTAADLDQVVAIDAAGSGRPRPAFYTPRLAAVADGDDLGIAATHGEDVVGFAFARVLDGEFGGLGPVGVLDAVAVAPDEQHHGRGHDLLTALSEALRARGVGELRTQASWREHDLVSFFGAGGFDLAPQLVLEREVDLPFVDDVDADLSLVHSLADSDLPAIIEIDTRVTGRDRTAYYRRLVREANSRAGVRVSLVAAADDQVVGFLMARVDYGGFGTLEPTAVLDTVGVDPGFTGGHIGRTLLEQLLINLRSLRVEQLRTEVDWSEASLLAFLQHTGFVPAQRLAFRLGLGATG